MGQFTASDIDPVTLGARRGGSQVTQEDVKAAAIDQNAKTISRDYAKSFPLMVGGGLSNVAEESQSLLPYLRRLGVKIFGDGNPVTPASETIQTVAGTSSTASAAPEAAIAPTASATNATASGAGIPRTLSGDSALRQVLTGQDNANLLKIAKSRGINVTQEAQLKPGTADGRLISKIVDDFSDEELENMRSTFLENTRMGKHQFGDVGPEAWKTMSLQTYFPDVKIPVAMLKRTQSAISRVAEAASPTVNAPTEDLLPQLQESLKRAQAARQVAPAQ